VTMPQYQNCSHQGEGWCLACVDRQAISLSNAESQLIKANAEIAALRQMLREELAIRDVWLDALRGEVRARREPYDDTATVVQRERAKARTDSIGALAGDGLRAYSCWLTKATNSRLKDGYQSGIALSFTDRTQSGVPNVPFVLVSLTPEK